MVLEPISPFVSHQSTFEKNGKKEEVGLHLTQRLNNPLTKKLNFFFRKKNQTPKGNNQHESAE